MRYEYEVIQMKEHSSEAAVLQVNGRELKVHVVCVRASHLVERSFTSSKIFERKIERAASPAAASRQWTWASEALAAVAAARRLRGLRLLLQLIQRRLLRRARHPAADSIVTHSSRRDYPLQSRGVNIKLATI